MSLTRKTALPVRMLWFLLAICCWHHLQANGPGSLMPDPAPADMEGDVQETAISAVQARSGPSTFEQLQDDLAQAEQQGDLQAQLRILTERSAMEVQLGMPIAALQTAFQLLDLAQASGDPGSIARALQCSSTAHHANRRNDEALATARNALAITVASRQQDAVAEARSFLLDMLIRCGQHREAFDMADELLTSSGSEGNSIGHARLWWAMARNSMAQERYTDASLFLFRAAPVIDAEGSMDERFSLHLDKARTCIALGRSNDAERALNEASTMLPTVRNANAGPQITEVRYAHALSQGQWHEALLLLQAVQAYKDSMDHGAQDIIIGRVQAMHQLDRNERDNASLRESNAEKERIISDQRAGNRYLVMLAGGLLVFAVALFITARHSLRMMRRVALKNTLIRKQRDEIQGMNIELQRQNLRLSEALLNEEQQEITLKEIHHRVKNNLQVVDSLLTAQSIGMSDPYVERLLREAQGRIRSMAMVHEHIYRSGGHVQGTLQEYLSQLVRNVIVAYGVHDRTSVTVDARLPILDENALMPLSLLLNELITNSVKYAFIGRESGHIHIAVRMVGSGYELIYTDNGTGFTDDTGERPRRSFGMELVKALADQLNGDLTPIKAGGTGFKLTFRPDAPAMRAAS